MTKTDKLIFWGVLLVSLVCLLFSGIVFQKRATAIVILAEGKPYASYKTEDLLSPKTLTVTTSYGNVKVEVSKDGARIFESDCDDGRCLGVAKSVGDILVCLPNQVIVKIEGAGEVDGVAY